MLKVCQIVNISLSNPSWSGAEILRGFNSKLLLFYNNCPRTSHSERAWRFLDSLPNIRFHIASGRVGDSILRVLKERKPGLFPGITPSYGTSLLFRMQRTSGPRELYPPMQLVPLTISSWHCHQRELSPRTRNRMKNKSGIVNVKCDQGWDSSGGRSCGGNGGGGRSTIKESLLPASCRWFVWLCACPPVLKTFPRQRGAKGSEPLKIWPKLRTMALSCSKSQWGSGLSPYIQQVSDLSHKILKATAVCPRLWTVWMRSKSQKPQPLSSNENATSKKKVTTVKEVKSQPQQTFEAGEDGN